MIFNGHTEEYIDSLDEDIFSEIQVMFADGLLGNKGIFDAIAPLTAGVFNYLRTSNSAPYKSTDIFPHVVEYSVNPDYEMTDKEKVSESLLLFMTQANGFSKERFKHGG